MMSKITDIRDAGADFSMHKSDPESEHSEQSSDNIPMQDEGNESDMEDMEDTDNAHIPKVLTTTWFKPIPESERPNTPEPEWTIPPNDFPEPENNWALGKYNAPQHEHKEEAHVKADLEGPAFNLVKSLHKNSVFLQYQMDECHKLLTNKVDLSNPEGHQILQNIYEPLPLGGPPGQFHAIEVEMNANMTSVRFYGITHWWFRRKEFYINKHSEPSDREGEIRVETNKARDWKVIKTKINLNVQIGMAPTITSNKIHDVLRPRAVVYRDRNDQRKLMRLNELHKFSDGTLTRVMENLDHMVKDFHLFEYNKGMETRKWSED
ncbi:hypothetical protein Tco_0015592 [Tanacetum coccineum]